MKELKPSADTQPSLAFEERVQKEFFHHPLQRKSTIINVIVLNCTAKGTTSSLTKSRMCSEQ